MGRIVNPSEDYSDLFEVKRYGTFEMTDAVRSLPDTGIVPIEGYRHDRSGSASGDIPVIMATASREKLWDLFHDLLGVMGDHFDVILETSHDCVSDDDPVVELARDSIESLMLQSYLADYEDVLLNDGYTGIAVMRREAQRELQFDSHKNLIIFGQQLRSSEQVLNHYGIPHRQHMRLISDGRHIHSSDSELKGRFQELCMELHAEEREDEW